jgi:hypothetical protein
MLGAQRRWSHMKFACLPSQCDKVSVLNLTGLRFNIGVLVCFLLGDSPASEIYMPTFRNTLSVPSS